MIFLGIFFAVHEGGPFKQFVFKKTWAIFLILTAFSIGYSPEKSEAIKLWVDLLTYPVMFFLPYALIKNARDQKFWLKVLLGASILGCFFAYLNFIKGGTHSADASALNRISGTFSHPNILALFILFSIVLVFYLLESGALGENRLVRTALFSYEIALFVIFLATKTRSVWFAGWIFFALYGLLRDRKYLILALVIPVLLFLIPPIQVRILDLFSHTHGDFESGLNSFAWRQLLWKNSLEEVKNHFVLGQGLASFIPVSIRFLGAGVSKGIGAHNTYLQVIFETGFLGLCAFLGIFYSVVRAILTGARSVFALSVKQTIALLFLAGYAVACFGDNLLYYLSYNWYFWFFLGMLTRPIQVHEE